MELDCDADDEALHRLAVGTERSWVVGQSLAHPPSIHVVRAWGGLGQD